MCDTTDLDMVLMAIHSAAKKVDAFVAEVVLAIDDAYAPLAVLDAPTMIALIDHVRPRIVYCMRIPFEASEYALASLSDDDTEEAVLEHPSIRKLIDRWVYRSGQTAQIAVTIMESGVIHGLMADASWLAQFESEIEAHRKEVDKRTAEHVWAEEKEAKRLLEPMLKILMADPRFSGPKVGNAKRMILAEALFPDADSSTLDTLVEMAEAKHWLAGGR